MATERIQLSVGLRPGSTPTRFLAAIRDYALGPRGPWRVVSRRPFVLHHASRRAKGVSYRFSADRDGAVELKVSGKEARLALAYAVTLLANAQFAGHVESCTWRASGATGPARRVTRKVRTRAKPSRTRRAK